MFAGVGEQTRVDHLVFFVHGIGAHHDLSFRRLVDCGKYAEHDAGALVSETVYGSLQVGWKSASCKQFH